MVTHRTDTLGCNPATVGSVPTRVGPTQPLTAESEYRPISSLGWFPTTECGVFLHMHNYDITLDIKEVASLNLGHLSLVSTGGNIS